MKVLGFHEFAALPEGTIFSYFKPMVCEGLCRKGKTLHRGGDEGGEPCDFFECSLVPTCWNGEPPTVDSVESRWGIFDFDQQFAVFDDEDVAVLCQLLGEAERGGGEQGDDRLGPVGG